jgi:hypothetical protein
MTAVIEKMHRLRREIIKHLYYNKMLTLNGLCFFTHNGRLWTNIIVNYFLNRKKRPIQYTKSKHLVAAILVV